jgi:hypothetical protein
LPSFDKTSPSISSTTAKSLDKSEPIAKPLDHFKASDKPEPTVKPLEHFKPSDKSEPTAKPISTGTSSRKYRLREKAPEWLKELESIKDLIVDAEGELEKAEQ